MIMAEKNLWNRRASNTWWRTALQHAEPSLRGGVFFNVHPLTQLAWSDPAVPPPPESLRLQAQVRGRFATDPSLHGPSLLPFPGCGVVNSAARTMAISTNWQHVRATAAALESGDESPDHVVDIFESSIRGMWQVAPNDLEYVIAKALVDQLVRARRADNHLHSPTPTTELSTELDYSKMYAAWRRAGLSCPEASSRVPSDGWRHQQGESSCTLPSSSVLFLDSADVMSSRDLEPVIWPKAWHFASKMATLDGSDKALLACFGTVPVQWVPEVNRWMSGNRHRVAAAMLHGTSFAATSKSGSPCVTLVR
jgi:hypothetical protein